jgi:hypothetical protein
MVAVIHKSSSLRNILNYNEQKVKAGLAACLEASGYPKEAADLNFHQKLRRLELLTELNQRTTANSVHISLNFGPSERLSNKQLLEIAAVYMDKIGFGGQPYLLYEHLDSGHPHVHLLTTNIKPDGKRIDMNNIGRNQSETARKEIEIAYSLVKAEESKLQRAYKLKPVNAQKVKYGKAETKRSISNVLGFVLPLYKYASLPELNAVLRQYNIVADRGEESSRIFQHQGLVYRLLDEQGKKVGIPIKASLFFNKPTLKFLTDRFAKNQALKESPTDKARVKNAIDLFFLHGQKSLNDLVAALKKDGIDVVVRQNEDGVIYGLTYVDHKTHCIYNGSGLGKAYSAKGVTERCGERLAGGEKIKAGLGEKQGSASSGKERIAGEGKEKLIGGLPDLSRLADALLGADDNGKMDWELKRLKKKRKKRQQPE